MAAVKICGINSDAAFDAAVEAGADWIGFVFYARSPRYVTAAQAAAISARSSGGPPRVGLFVGATDENIGTVLADIKLDILQLYDPPGRVAEIALGFGLPVWRSVSVAPGDALPEHSGAASALLVEPTGGFCRAGGRTSPGCSPAGSTPATCARPSQPAAPPPWMCPAAWKPRPVRNLHP
jgi:phosphoribosylanthranilate isomerase